MFVSRWGSFWSGGSPGFQGHVQALWGPKAVTHSRATLAKEATHRPGSFGGAGARDEEDQLREEGCLCG